MLVTSILEKQVTLPRFGPIGAGLAYNYGDNIGDSLPRSGFRYLRGFVIMDQAFTFDLYHFSPRGTGLIIRTASVFDPIMNAHLAILSDVLFFGHTWGVRITNLAANPTTAQDYSLELVP